MLDGHASTRVGVFMAGSVRCKNEQIRTELNLEITCAFQPALCSALALFFRPIRDFP
jgi:hypothetical protein